LLDDRLLAVQLGQAARQLIQDRFSVDRMVQSTEQLYTELLARRQPTALRTALQRSA
jgi:hypothetical protein